MASMPGILTDWPWKPLGSFKYLLLAPWAIHSFYSFLVKDKSERDISTFLILPFLLWRMLHNQIWITLSRYRTAKGNTRIVDKGIEFDQVDREREWDDQILFNGLLYYLGCYTISRATHLPLWRTDGVVMTILLHMGPVEFLYYWLHRALHHHFFYSRYHSHHHSSIVTEPITFLQSQKVAINTMIEEAILHADRKGIKVLSLGLMNQGEDLNIYGSMYVSRHPKLKVKIVDGSSLVVAIVLNSIPKGTTQVLLNGKLTKVAHALAFTLCQQGVQVVTLHENDYVRLKKSFTGSETNLAYTRSYTQTIWLVGDGLTKEEQQKTLKTTLFILYTQFSPKKYRKDYSYQCTSAMLAPCTIENVHSCEDWLPRRVMSAWRIAGIVHSLERWSEHECGHTMHNVDKVWHSTLQHGFQPLPESLKELAHY
ncbi:hypothetical protein Fmac_028340 [Flemingia macrophylla]|uniref:Very-long-chain aldehyde decarbonylase CER1-like C-terminal domain-containing protein n=1 Tax=Flemingia macrophylla TaxID=520843 RepID=A0ABD1L790_9FABA